MDEINSLVETIHLSFEGVLRQLNFKEGEQRHFERGATISYRNDDFRIEFAYDRGIVETGVGPLGDDWTVGVENMKAFISLKESSGILGVAERKLIIATRLSHNEQAQFLLNSSALIGNALSKSNSHGTRKEIRALYDERWGFGMYK